MGWAHVTLALACRWPQLLRDLCHVRVRTLFCPRAALEVLALLRRISASCHLVSGQVATSAELWHRQWEDRALRSRQRQTYLRLTRRCVAHGPALGRPLPRCVSSPSSGERLVFRDSYSVCHCKMLLVILEHGFYPNEYLDLKYSSGLTRGCQRHGFLASVYRRMCRSLKKLPS